MIRKAILWVSMICSIFVACAFAVLPMQDAQAADGCAGTQTKRALVTKRNAMSMAVVSTTSCRVASCRVLGSTAAYQLLEGTPAVPYLYTLEAVAGTAPASPGCNLPSGVGWELP